MSATSNFTPRDDDDQTIPSGWLTAIYVGPHLNINFTRNQEYRIKYRKFSRADADAAGHSFSVLTATGSDGRGQWLFSDRQLGWFEVESDVDVGVRKWLRLTTKLAERNRLIDQAIAQLHQAKVTLEEWQNGD